MKNTKIAGIAAVTLLAVSPVITSAVSTDCVQASGLSDLFSNPSDTQDQIKKVTNTISELPDQTYSDENQMPVPTEFNALSGLSESGKGVSPVQFSSFIVSVNLGINSDAISALANSKVQGLKIYISGNSLKQAVSNTYNRGNGNSFSFTITVKNGDNTLTTKKLTYTNNAKKVVTDQDSNSNNSDGLSNVTNLTGNHSVNLAGSNNSVYALYSLSGKKSNRGLAGNTAWFTDKTATDSRGNTYYRVSTDEWIESNSNLTFN
ncbi:hypothetical protein [Companilactobacillus mishanensis]|uniref:hypothetical protein n=1 Tax=Companilactobacillus mishanensis TaxID=2486008 RepID=UPI00129769AA|nr:hypothetical protein [Companilactobacillus mishanensis]MQS89639.1 hypothetical protein [Companilactobacillus mishanensis]